MTIFRGAPLSESRAWAPDLWRLALVLGLLFSLLLGSRALGAPDEARYSEIPREMVATSHYITPHLNGVTYLEKPPLFYWLQAVSIKLFGLSEWSMRLWTGLFAWIGCLATYAVGRFLFDRRTGIISSVVLATSFLYYGMSRVVTLDMAVSVLITLTLYAFLVALRFPIGPVRRRFMWAAFAGAALAVLTKGLIGIVFPMLIIGVWILMLNRWRLLTEIYLPTGFLWFFVIAVPWHVLAQMHNPEFFHYYFIHQQFARFLTPVSHRPGPPWYFVTVVLLGFFPWSPFLFQAVASTVEFGREARQHRDLELFLFLWAVLIFLFFSASHSKLIPYILPIFPALALLVGRYFARQWDRPSTRGLSAGYRILAISGVVLSVVIYFVPQFRPSLHPHSLVIYMHVLSLILALTSITAAVLGGRRGLPAAVVTVVAGFSVFLVTLNAAMPDLDIRSIKPLALSLKQQLKPGDEVASYHAYYQDLPFYLRRIVTVVNWQGELAEGLKYGHYPWMIRGPTFWKQWASHRTIYMMTPRQEYDHLLPDHRNMYLVLQNPYNVVVCNKKPDS
ncbi:MAG: phospholipid carrier-dependent glycosyltransferase [Acidiferrobacteraceae bacterium]